MVTEQCSAGHVPQPGYQFIRTLLLTQLRDRGRLVASLIDPETGCTTEEMGEIPVRRPITIEPVKLTTPEWAHLNQKLDEDVA